MSDHPSTPARRGPYGLVGENDLPLCEECDLPMSPFASQGIEGYSCMGCGWSFDAPLNAPTVYPEFRNPAGAGGFRSDFSLHLKASAMTPKPQARPSASGAAEFSSEPKASPSAACAIPSHAFLIGSREDGVYAWHEPGRRVLSFAVDAARSMSDENAREVPAR